MQEGVVVHFLEETRGDFLANGWPLHITLVRPFQVVSTTEKFLNTLIGICHDALPAVSRVIGAAQFGQYNTCKAT